MLSDAVGDGVTVAFGAAAEHGNPGKGSAT